MRKSFNLMLDFISEFLARRKGLLPRIGLLLVVINAVMQFFPGIGWLVQISILLHLGIIITILGILFAGAL